jgi:hypothetical protein
MRNESTVIFIEPTDNSQEGVYTIQVTLTDDFVTDPKSTEYDITVTVNPLNETTTEQPEETVETTDVTLEEEEIVVQIEVETQVEEETEEVEEEIVEDQIEYIVDMQLDKID